MDNGATKMSQLLNRGALKKEPYSPTKQPTVEGKLPFDPSVFLSLVKEEKQKKTAEVQSPLNNFKDLLHSATQEKKSPQSIPFAGGLGALKTFTHYGDVTSNINGPTPQRKAMWREQFNQLQGSLYTQSQQQAQQAEQVPFKKNPFRERALVGVAQQGNQFGEINGKDFPENWDSTVEDYFFPQDNGGFSDKLQMSGDFSSKEDTSYSAPSIEHSNHFPSGFELDSSGSSLPPQDTTPPAPISPQSNSSHTDNTNQLDTVTQAFGEFLEEHNQIEKGSDPFANMDFNGAIAMFQSMFGSGEDSQVTSIQLDATDTINNLLQTVIGQLGQALSTQPFTDNTTPLAEKNTPPPQPKQASEHVLRNKQPQPKHENTGIREINDMSNDNSQTQNTPFQNTPNTPFSNINPQMLESIFGAMQQATGNEQNNSASTSNPMGNTDLGVLMNLLQGEQTTGTGQGEQPTPLAELLQSIQGQSNNQSASNGPPAMTTLLGMLNEQKNTSHADQTPTQNQQEQQNGPQSSTDISALLNMLQGNTDASSSSTVQANNSEERQSTAKRNDGNTSQQTTDTNQTSPQIDPQLLAQMLGSMQTNQSGDNNTLSDSVDMNTLFTMMQQNSRGQSNQNISQNSAQAQQNSAQAQGHTNQNSHSNTQSGNPMSSMMPMLMMQMMGGQNGDGQSNPMSSMMPMLMMNMMGGQNGDGQSNPMSSMMPMLMMNMMGGQNGDGQSNPMSSMMPMLMMNMMGGQNGDGQSNPMSSMMPMLMSQMMGGQNTASGTGNDMTNMMNMFGNMNTQNRQPQQNPFGNMGDMGNMMNMMNAFGGNTQRQTQPKDDVSSLLEALRPFLSEDRRQKIGSTMQILQTMPQNGQINS